MNILGLNSYHADSSASVFKNNQLVVAIEEERLSRIKHHSGFPIRSIEYCLSVAKLKPQDIDLVCVNFNKNYNLDKKFLYLLKNFYKSKSLFQSYIKSGKANFKKDIYSFFQKKIKIHYSPHHLTHVYSAIVNCGFNNGLCISFDGSGDFSTMEIYEFTNLNLKLVCKTNFPHSLGIFYQAITQYLGFHDYGDEYKVMGMAAYGKPIYENQLKKIINWKNGIFNLNLNYFQINELTLAKQATKNNKFFKLYNNYLDHLLGGQRFPGEAINQRHYNIAASLQKIFENVLIEICSYWNKKNYTNLCITGGCAFNTLANGKLLSSLKLEKIYVPSNPGDGGGSLGSVYDYLINKKKYSKIIIKKNPYLGKKYTKYEVLSAIQKYEDSNKMKLKFRFFNKFDNLTAFTAKKLSQNKIVAWFQDEAEFGPRALGNRSLVANPGYKGIKNFMNSIIKQRERFRPFAPSVLSKYQSDYFIVNKNFKSPFMNLVVKVKSSKRKKILGVLNVDKTSRVHTVEKKTNIKYYKLIKSFFKQTNLPMLLNTSLNIQEPICESPEDVLKSFVNSNVSIIVINNVVIFNN